MTFERLPRAVTHEDDGVCNGEELGIQEARGPHQRQRDNL